MANHPTNEGNPHHSACMAADGLRPLPFVGDSMASTHGPFKHREKIQQWPDLPLVVWVLLDHNLSKFFIEFKKFLLQCPVLLFPFKAHEEVLPVAPEVFVVGKGCQAFRHCELEVSRIPRAVHQHMLNHQVYQPVLSGLCQKFMVIKGLCVFHQG